MHTYNLRKEKQDKIVSHKLEIQLNLTLSKIQRGISRRNGVRTILRLLGQEPASS